MRLFINTRNQAMYRNGAIWDLALTTTVAFNGNHEDAFDSHCDEAPTPSVIFMANLTQGGPIYDDVGPTYDSDFISKVPYYDNYINDEIIAQDEQEMPNNDNEVATKILQNDISSVQPDNMILMSVIDTMKNQVTICNKAIDENRIANELLTAELERYKEKAKWIQPSLHDGNEIEKHVHAPTIMRDSEETLKLADESKAKMKERMSDPIAKK
ncbi:hypothetical protein Tco_0852680 [Tanacetum coccineum]